MLKLTIDFANIKSINQFHDFLEEKLDLNRYIKGGWGRNLNAFWDIYAYSNDNDFFEIRNYKKIEDVEFKKYIDEFIKLLNDLKGIKQEGKLIIPNPNFDYKIVD